MRLIITRHGETEENLLGVFQGHLPGKLSARGIAQAQSLAQRLKDEPIDFIYSSDLARAADTAREILQFHPSVPVEFTQDLRERYMGGYEGKSKKELGLYRGSKTPGFAPPGGEDDFALHMRAGNFLKRVLQERGGGETVLLVGHNGIGKNLIANLRQVEAEKVHAEDQLSNTSVSIFQLDKEGNVIETETLNCIKHLEGQGCLEMN